MAALTPIVGAIGVVGVLIMVVIVLYIVWAAAGDENHRTDPDTFESADYTEYDQDSGGTGQ